MRSSLSRIATAIMIGSLAAACAPAPSPTTISTQAPSPSAATAAPTSAPSAASLPPIATLPPTTPPPGGNLTRGAIAAGRDHTCALTSDGGVQCWGSNGSGQLGSGHGNDSGVPVDVVGLAKGATAVAAGSSHTCALTNTGKVRCWGDNSENQLGDITTADGYVPGLGGPVIAIVAGGQHTCALTSGGGVKCWGDNGLGQLGDGTTTDSMEPVDVLGLGSGVRAIAAGDIHTCALTAVGGVKCWGDGVYGQLGNGKSTDSIVPVAASGLASGVTAVVAGGLHTCALTTGGGVKCWGVSWTAQGGNSFRGNVPVDVPGLASGVAAITTGGDHTCALRTGGGLVCWGANSFGQLGNGTTIDTTVPVDVSGLSSGVTEVSAGAQHTCAVTSDARIMCWGSNSKGQLGSVQRCISNSVPTAVGTALSGEPTGPPSGRIAHATGSRDVILRFDIDPDHSVSDLGGELFKPGPEFTLYGDGTVIFRNDLAHPPAVEGPIVRGRPFKIAHLTETQVQELLRFALGRGGLWSACERYETRGIVDFAGLSTFTVRAGGLDKVVADASADAPLAALADRLRNLDRGGAISTKVWVPDRYWGVLLEANTFIKEGLLPAPPKAGAAPWPWPGIVPATFAGLGDSSDGRRVMSRTEAAVLGLSRNGGVVQRIYIRGPDGKTIYSFSLWPILPDETP